MSTGNQKGLILCIDDDPDFLNFLRLVLETAGYSILEAFTGTDGLRKFREHSPDLVIVDLMMEEIDAGVSLCTEIRALRSHVPIFLLSSVGERFTTTTDTSMLGFDAVLQKPFDEEALLKLVHAKIG